MAELSAEAPLAPSEEWSDFSDFQQADNLLSSDNGNETISSSSSATTAVTQLKNKTLDNVKRMEGGTSSSNNMAVEQFGETGGSFSLSSSLEDLVNTFDDKITKCFRDMDQNVESLAPVQIRNQDDIINESQQVQVSKFSFLITLTKTIEKERGNPRMTYCQLS